MSERMQNLTGETIVTIDGNKHRLGKMAGYGAQGGNGKDLAAFFNEDGLGAIVNSSRGIICAYKQDAYKDKFGPDNYADASRQAVLDMREDLKQAFVR